MSSNIPIVSPSDFAPAGNSVHRFTRDSEFITVNPAPDEGKSVTIRSGGVEINILLSSEAARHIAGLLTQAA